MKLILFLFLITIHKPVSAEQPRHFYPTSYKESQAHFKEVGKKLASLYDGEVRQAMVPTKTKEELSIASLYLPQKIQKIQKKTKLLILTSGVHGIEAFTGSAIQHLFLNQVLKKEDLDHMGILVIHGVNPYGFHFKRRVTENNVDLNRNFGGDNPLFSKKSQAYENLSPLLNPKKPLNAHGLGDILTFSKSMINLLQYGKKQLAQTAVGGQYQDNKGIYFGGDKLEPNVTIIKNLFKEYGKDYQQILHIDLHTGYGKKGKLHFFSNTKATQVSGFKSLFKGFNIDLGSDKDFYETSGSFDQFTMQVFAGKQAIPMTFEFGTMDSQTIMGGFYSLKNMIYENQGFHYGYTDPYSRKKIGSDFNKMFNPSDHNWRKRVLNQSKKRLSKILNRFKSL